MKFKDCLKRARENAGLTQRELAALLSVPPSMIGRYESSDTEPRVDLLKRICKALKITPNVLLNYESNNVNAPIEFLKKHNVRVEKGNILIGLKSVMTGKGAVSGYTLTLEETGEKLKIAEDELESFVEKVIEKAKRDNEEHFNMCLQRSLNIEFYRDYVFRNQYEELQYIQEELEKIKNSGDLMAIRRLQKQLKYLQCFYDKVNNNFEFIKELEVDKEYPFCEISEEHKKK